MDKLMPALLFINKIEKEGFTFSTDNWEANTKEEIAGWKKSVKVWKETFPSTTLYFLVDTKDKSSATMVLVIPKNTKGFWEIFNAFIESWGPGDRLEVQDKKDCVHVHLWHD